jgi:outer membrane receptor protein involved in Fe transport
MKKAISLAVAGLMFGQAAGPVAASAAIGAEELFFADLPMVTVASKTHESVLGASGTVIVFTEEDIKKFGWRDLKEILSAVPNMDLKYDYHWLQGGQRGFTGSFNASLLMIDGREVQNLIANEMFIRNNYPAHRIKRIEILQGPSSSLYGPNAMEGIINIVTKVVAEDQTDTHQFSYTQGDAGHQEVSGLYRVNGDDHSLSFSASHYKMDMDWKKLADFWADDARYSRTPSFDAYRDHDTRNFANNEEGYTFDLHGRYKGFYAGVNLFHSESLLGLESLKYDQFQRRNPRDTRLDYMGVKHAFGDGLKGSLEVQRVNELTRAIRPSEVNKSSWTSYGNIQMDYTGTRGHLWENRLLGQLEWVPNRHTVVAGFDVRRLGQRHTALSNRPYGSEEGALDPNFFAPIKALGLDKRRVSSVYLQDSVFFFDNRLKWTLGGNYTMHNQAKSTFNPRSSLVFQPTPASAFKLTYGTGFRAPTVFEMTSTAKIAPMRMRMVELNYSQDLITGPFRLQNIAAVYKMTARDTIRKVARIPNPVGLGDFETKTEGTFSVEGFEDFLRFDIKKLSGFAGVRWVSPDKTRVAGEDITAEVPVTKQKLGVSYSFLEKLTASLFVDRWDKVQSDVNPLSGSGTEVLTVPSWTVAHVNVILGDFDMGNGDKASFSFHVENIADRTYYHANTRGKSPVQFMQPPRTWRLTASTTF